MTGRKDSEKRKSILPLSGNEKPPEKPMQNIPVGIEQILAMAAVDEKFAKALLDSRDAAANASGVELTPTEKRILLSIDKDALSQMIENVRGRIPAQERRAFIKKSAAALLALVGAGFLAATTGCTEYTYYSTGVLPDRPEPKQPRTKGIQPDRPPEKK